MVYDIEDRVVTFRHRERADKVDGYDVPWL